mmetsp:Transcript_19655/g.63860  ORF Transcript_19655/g.63860 Transcript_19655/m.63860 type:complete len:215 (-) Transcript_19655:72-716(-)
MVAAFSDADVCGVRGREPQPLRLGPERDGCRPHRNLRRRRRRPIATATDGVRNHRRELGIVFKADDKVHLRERVGEVLRVALREASRHHDALLLLRALAQTRRFQNRRHRLILRILHKPARIDDDGVRLFVVVDDVETLLEQVSEHHLAVYYVFGASERGHRDSHRRPALRAVALAGRMRRQTRRVLLRRLRRSLGLGHGSRLLESAPTSVVAS